MAWGGGGGGHVEDKTLFKMLCFEISKPFPMTKINMKPKECHSDFKELTSLQTPLKRGCFRTLPLQLSL